MSIENLLIEHATALRRYLESSHAGTYVEVLKLFPDSCCSVSSKFFLKLLSDKEHIYRGVLVANGRRECATHAWAELDEYIIDITADQFSDFHTPVFVGKNSDWHSTFAGATRHGHHESVRFDFCHQSEYDLLLTHIDNFKQ
ncbi:MAG: hypothetical protein H6815_01805 [Phycisphaeraceae bacterium]|nr:hypothetical protein [Phycisphaerales bacterium]MCB9859163.1 hypothetical protein [Phycisphaeraceae bacterium]